MRIAIHRNVKDPFPLTATGNHYRLEMGKMGMKVSEKEKKKKKKRREKYEISRGQINSRMIEIQGR